MVWEDYIYYLPAVKYGLSALKILTGDTLDIYEWLEFELYDLVWFWKNQSDDTKLIFGTLYRGIT